MAFLGDEGASMRELFPCHSDGLQALVASIDRFGRVEDPTRGSAVVSVYSPDTWRGKDFEEAFNRWTASVSRARIVGHETPAEVAATLVKEGMLSCGELELAKSVFSGRMYAEIDELVKVVRESVADGEKWKKVVKEKTARPAMGVTAVWMPHKKGRKRKKEKTRGVTLSGHADYRRSHDQTPCGAGVECQGVLARSEGEGFANEGHDENIKDAVTRGPKGATTPEDHNTEDSEYGAEYWRSKEIPSMEDLKDRWNDPDFQEVLSMWNEIAALTEELAPWEADSWGVVEDDPGWKPANSHMETWLDEGARAGELSDQGSLVPRERSKGGQVDWDTAGPKDGATQYLDGVETTLKETSDKEGTATTTSASEAVGSGRLEMPHTQAGEATTSPRTGRAYCARIGTAVLEDSEVSNSCAGLRVLIPPSVKVGMIRVGTRRSRSRSPPDPTPQEGMGEPRASSGDESMPGLDPPERPPEDPRAAELRNAIVANNTKLAIDVGSYIIIERGKYEGLSFKDAMSADPFGVLCLSEIDPGGDGEEMAMLHDWSEMVWEILTQRPDVQRGPGRAGFLPMESEIPTDRVHREAIRSMHNPGQWQLGVISVIADARKTGSLSLRQRASRPRQAPDPPREEATGSRPWPVPRRTESPRRGTTVRATWDSEDRRVPLGVLTDPQVPDSLDHRDSGEGWAVLTSDWKATTRETRANRECPVVWTILNRGHSHVLSIATAMRLCPEAVEFRSPRPSSRSFVDEGSSRSQRISLVSQTWGTIDVQICESEINYICWNLLSEDWKMEVTRSGGKIWRMQSARAQRWRSADHRIWSFHWPAYDGERPEVPRTWRRYRLPEELVIRVLRRRLLAMPICADQMTIALEPSDEATAASELELRHDQGSTQGVVADRRTGNLWPEIPAAVAADLMLGGRGVREWPWEDRHLGRQFGGHREAQDDHRRPTG